MLKCGFIDHHLVGNSHADKFLGLFHGELADAGVRVSYAYESCPTGEKDWCLANNVERCDRPEQVVEKSDVIMVLLPDNIDEHMTLGKAAFQSGKRVYVDKYLAGNFPDAEQIVSLCQENKSSLLCASALRFAVELENALAENASPVSVMYAHGPNAWPWYACHTLAPVMRVMGSDIEKIINTGTQDAAIVTMVYRDGRSALVETRQSSNAFEAFGWQVGMKQKDCYSSFQLAVGESIYRNLIAHVANWFREGKTDITTDEMLKTVWVLDNALKSRRDGGKWIICPK